MSTFRDEESLQDVQFDSKEATTEGLRGTVSSVKTSYPVSFKEKVKEKLHPKNVWKFINHTYGPYGPIIMPGSAKEFFKDVFLSLIKNGIAGVTVGLVSIPLSISLGLAGGATPLMGIITACWSGLMSAVLGGSHFNIMGPTGALSGNLSAFVVKQGDDIFYGQQLLCVLAIVSGIMCLGVFFARLDKYALFIPGAVVHGFTVGVAFIIAFNQMNYALGVSPKHRHQEFIWNVVESFKEIPHLSWWTLLVFVVTLVLLFVLLKLLPRVPWNILIALVGVLFGWLIDAKYIKVNILTISSKYGELTPNLVQLPQVGWEDFIREDVITASFAICMIEVLETLISAKIADQMTNTQFSQPREVFGLAVANIASGIFGGIPATAALARTALNIKSGATSRLSGIISALSIFAISLILLPIFKFLLLPVVAAILCIVAIRMVEYDHILHLIKGDWKMAILFFFCTAVCVLIGPTEAIIIGLIIGLLLNATFSSWGHGEIQVATSQKQTGILTSFQFDDDFYKLNEPKFFLKKEEVHSSAKVPLAEADGESFVYRILGELNYLNSQAHVERVKKLIKKGHRKVFILCLKHLYYIDYDGKEALHEIIKEIEHKKIKVLLSGGSKIERAIVKQTWYQKLVHENAVYKSNKDALRDLDNVVAMIVQQEREKEATEAGVNDSINNEKEQKQNEEIEQQQ